MGCADTTILTIRRKLFNMQNLIKAILQKQGVCYLNLSEEDLKSWNFVNANPPLLNTKLLFYAAARPHFDYFFSRADYLGLAGQEFLGLVEDEKFKQLLGKFTGKFVDHGLFLKTAETILKQNIHITLITTSNFQPAFNFKANKTIFIDDINLFGNPEPVWRKIQSQLPKTPTVFFLALGLEKFLIGPRLKLKFGSPVVDIGLKKPEKTKLGKKIKILVKKFINK